MMLSINKVITPKQTGKTSSGSDVDYSYFDKLTKKKGGETIERNIQWYRMWYTFLKLALELEQKKIPVNKKLLKVDRKFYKQWDVSELLNTTFDNWWKEHKKLFVLEQIQVVKSYDMHLANIHEDNDDYVYLKIPTTRNERELLSELSDMVKDKLKGEGDKPNYPFSNSGINYLNLHVTYNCLVMNINGKTGTKILEWINDKYSIHNNGEEYFGYEQSVSRVLVKGRKTLENVCSSIFP